MYHHNSEKFCYTVHEEQYLYVLTLCMIALFCLKADEREQKARDYMRAEVGYI